MGGSWQNFSKPVPPERGSFPLDYKKICDTQVTEYLECLKLHKNETTKCKESAKKYLLCRMENNLMDKEDLKDLGFKQ